MNKFVRTALLAAFTAAAAPAMAQDAAPRLSQEHADYYMNEIFERSLREAEAATTDMPGPLTPGACYTLHDGMSLQQYSGSDLGIEGHIELLSVMERKIDKIFYSDGDEIKVTEHFDSAAAFEAKYKGLTVVPGAVTIGCYDSAYDAQRDRDRLNKTAAKIYRDDIRAKLDALTVK